MKRKVFYVAVALLFSALSASHAVVITTFRDSDFAVDFGISSFSTINANPANVEVAGTDFGQSLAGTFSPVNIAGLSSISLTGTVMGTNPNSDFTVLLFSSTFEQREYSGNLASFGNSSSSLLLTFVSESAAFDEIIGFQFIGGGSDSPLSFTFEGLSATAIPEPSTWLLLAAGLGLLFLGAKLRRGRKCHAGRC